MSNKKNIPRCLFCENTTYKKTAYEDTLFNHKIFEYIQCLNCKLVYVNPLPGHDDLVKMYPVSYQGELVTKSTGCYDKIFNLINQYGNYTAILDYGCGGGKFIIEALSKQFKTTGVEFNPLLVEHLKKQFPEETFYTNEEIIGTETQYDVIFLSNVLEHLTSPIETLLFLKSKLNDNGIFVIEGPIENNFHLTKIFRKTIFYIRKNFFNSKVSHAPTHVLYANRKNQEMFFRKIGLLTLYFEIDEINWPFPMTYKECDTLKKKFLYFIASVSVKFGKTIPNWGNVFLYIGKVHRSSN